MNAIEIFTEIIEKNNLKSFHMRDLLKIDTRISRNNISKKMRILIKLGFITTELKERNCFIYTRTEKKYEK